jgi:preprotein translocase subunit SecF
MKIREAVNTFRGHRVPHLNLIAHKRWWFALSGFFIVLSIVGLALRNLNFSIEFKGGSILQFPNVSGAPVKEYQSIMVRFGVADAETELIGGGNCPSGCVQIKTKRSLTDLGVTAPAPSPSPSASASASASPSASASASPSASASASASPSASASASPSPSPSPTASASPTPQASGSAAATPVPTPTAAPTFKADLLKAALASRAGISINDISGQEVSATWGSTISRKALTALVVFLLLVSLYITLRFEWKMSVGALVALAHDLIITAGIYALVGREVTPETVIAILTILGYSLYDTVVIFDKVKENTESASLVAREGYSNVVNMSLNQTLMRSVNTSLVVLFPIGALLLFGGATLKDFAFALFIGVASGAYSSIFIAAPILAVLKEQEPRYQTIRARAEARSGRPGLRAAPSAGTLVEGRRELEPAGVAARSGEEGAPATGARPSGRPRAGSQKKKKGKPQGKPKRRRR